MIVCPLAGIDGLRQAGPFFGGQVELLEFAPLFEVARGRVRSMTVKVVAVDDPIMQRLLEMYVHLALNTPYNSFETH